MSLEKGFWASIKRSTVHMEGLSGDRIESEATPGFPDLVLCYNGVYALLELKVAKSNKLILTQSQLPWHKIHDKAKGNHWIFFKNENVYGVFKVKNVNKDYIKNMVDGCSKICLEGQWLMYDDHLILTRSNDLPLKEIYKRIIEYVCKKRY